MKTLSWLQSGSMSRLEAEGHVLRSYPGKPNIQAFNLPAKSRKRHIGKPSFLQPLVMNCGMFHIGLQNQNRSERTATSLKRPRQPCSGRKHLPW